MKPEMMKDVEDIIKESLARSIIKINYAVGIKNHTLPGYVIFYSVNRPEEKLVSPNGDYIKICNMLDSKKNIIKGIVPSKINIKNIYWLEVLDYPFFYEENILPQSDIVEICFKHKLNKPNIKGLFTLGDKENTGKSLKKIEKITKSKYPSFEFGSTNDLVVLKRFD